MNGVVINSLLIAILFSIIRVLQPIRADSQDVIVKDSRILQILCSQTNSLESAVVGYLYHRNRETLQIKVFFFSDSIPLSIWYQLLEICWYMLYAPGHGQILCILHVCKKKKKIFIHFLGIVFFRLFLLIVLFKSKISFLFPLLVFISYLPLSVIDEILTIGFSTYFRYFEVIIKNVSLELSFWWIKTFIKI